MLLEPASPIVPPAMPAEPALPEFVEPPWLLPPFAVPPFDEPPFDEPPFAEPPLDAPPEPAIGVSPGVSCDSPSSEHEKAPPVQIAQASARKLRARIKPILQIS
jgi:hypothetical protein